MQYSATTRQRGSRASRLAVLLLAVGLSTILLAAPELVRNINSVPIARSSDPKFIGTTPGFGIFRAINDDASAYILWRTDGTAAGTQPIAGTRVADLPIDYASFGSRVLFIGVDSGGAARIMSTDGTSAGTVTLPDSRIVSVLNVVASLPNGTQLFSVRFQNNEAELWSSDGTVANTRILGPIAASSTWVNSPVVGNAAFFTAFTADAGEEVWRSDGTVAGTQRMPEVEVGPASSLPRFIGVLNNEVYWASGAVAGQYLYRAGATGPAALHADVIPGFGAQFERGIFAAPGGTVFVANGALYFRNGTTGALTALLDAARGFDQIALLGRVGSRVLLQARTAQYGIELWVTDGTPAGTTVVSDLAPGAANSVIAGLGQLDDNQVLFTLGNIGTDQQLWVSNGSAGGTRAVTVSSSADLGTDPLLLRGSRTTGMSLWRVNRNTGAAREEIVSLYTEDLSLRMRTGNQYFFSGSLPDLGREPAVADLNGTRIIRDLQVSTADMSSAPLGIVTLGNQIFFSADDGAAGGELWRSDGTTIGTQLLKDIYPGPTGSAPGMLRVVGNRLFFQAEEAASGRETWVSDGTLAGTRLLVDADPGPAPGASTFTLGTRDFNCDARWVDGDDSRVFLIAVNRANGSELWISDATGTRMVVDLVPGPGSSAPCGLFYSNGLVYFQAYAAPQGWGLFRSDGTASGTIRLLTTEPPAEGPLLHDFTPFGGGVVFSTNGSPTRLWFTDGTVTGTRRISPEASLPNPRFGRLIGAVGNRLVFSASSNLVFGLYTADSTNGPATLLSADCGDLGDPGARTRTLLYAFGNRPCVTDGTAANTRRVEVDVRLSESYGADRTLAVDDVLYFFGGDATSAGRLWKTDGSAAGTRALSLGAVGVTRGLGRVGNRVLFNGLSDSQGSELWAWTGSAPVAQGDSASATVGTSTTISVLSNDTDADGQLLARSLRITEAPSLGTVTVNPDGTIGFSATTAGTSTFRYVVADDSGFLSAPAQVTVTVAAAPGGGSGGGGSGGGGSSGSSGGGGALGQVWLGLLAAALIARRRQLAT